MTHSNHRRNVLKLLAAGIGSLSALAVASENKPAIGAMLPGKGWQSRSTTGCEGDGTPLQFLPKTQPDDSPLSDELKKYPSCPYCGMSRTKFNHSRHLVQYDDNLVDGTCSVHCLAISLSLNLDRGPKAIYAADFGSPESVKPMIPADSAHYLIGSQLKATMSRTSKVAFATQQAAEKAADTNGGTIADFDTALTAAYTDMATDTISIRKRRAEKRRHMMKKMEGN